ncbi:radical SAM family heme chaperone HemW [Pukyongiella litopenaei]|uniref:Heme chaperone HemW n=1 Tax=Pukyongiella litopenaei TaxID=2605946 RepID=A0A2S0MPQ0_9RHOB|nr:radical SAM family heme chaperone HemW [Pukyongiella litopenaei]AVO37848.1 coproporphyrinogen III oxidase [Pukyongiella litopenaei]
MAEDWQQGGFGLYVHWPFCEAKCPYCDFNSHVSRRIDQTRWRDAYLRELDRVAHDLPGRALNSIFFGGGTPSLMDPDTVAAIVVRAREHWAFSNDMEITLEANPGSVEAGRFAGYRDAGVNRVSMGVQALDDDDLRRLGRIHTVAEARAAFDIARTCFDRVSFDLIYARQDQTLADWRNELRQALDMAIDHLSLYQLTIEPGTAFGDRHARGGLRGLPDDDRAADMFEATQEICDAHGLPAYEVSNHARPEAQSRHNLIYWRYGDYAGIGPGAHGRVTLNGARHATTCHRLPDAWLSASEAGNGDDSRDRLSKTEQAEEYLLMGLRITEGISLSRYQALAGVPLDRTRCNRLEELGLVNVTEDRLSVTKQGVMVLNAILEDLLPDPGRP